MSDIISDERAKKALEYLVATDEVAAKARSFQKGVEKQEKTVIALAYAELKLNGPKMGVEDCRQAAYTSTDYGDWHKKYIDALAEFETYRNRRETAALVIEMWRTEQANKRTGNV